MIIKPIKHPRIYNNWDALSTIATPTKTTTDIFQQILESKNNKKADLLSVIIVFLSFKIVNQLLFNTFKNDSERTILKCKTKQKAHKK